MMRHPLGLDSSYRAQRRPALQVIRDTGVGYITFTRALHARSPVLPPDATSRALPRPVGAVRSAGIVADGRRSRRVPRNPANPRLVGLSKRFPREKSPRQWPRTLPPAALRPDWSSWSPVPARTCRRCSTPSRPTPPTVPGSSRWAPTARASRAWSGPPAPGCRPSWSRSATTRTAARGTPR
ncbi:hypothetical protein SBRY_10351 [Actinacidiphila bryophytorum]|uniref:Uncharacterized protein n=1 Tax=Actinacidiphila bryophytorum TaxID=1436133 RepID=A0A9W4GWQ2_9ACTN|nr:hypothetical protein SBRY_10351 [Actinacidiphila bryophytorum]